MTAALGWCMSHLVVPVIMITVAGGTAAMLVLYLSELTFGWPASVCR